MDRQIQLICFFLFLCLSVSITAHAGEPEDLIKKTVNDIIGILKNEEMKKPDRILERRDELRKVITDSFDFEEMAKRSLALHWRKRTQDEKQAFVPLFSDLLERSYVNKIESYTDEKILYTDEEIDGKYAEVKTKIITKRNVEIPIEYRLLKKNEQWGVYDVVIEGVSLVNNYRNQFNSIIRRDSFEDLVKRMKQKQEEEEYEEKM